MKTASILCFPLLGASAYDLWPLPKSVSYGESVVTVDSGLNFVMFDGSTPTSEVLESAFLRYASSITDGFACSAARQDQLSRVRGRRQGSAAAATLSSCVVDVTDQGATLGETTDESYELSVGLDGSCSISAVTPFGALRALESLSQLAGEACAIENAPVDITDSPRFG